jgi:hypothetical protein
MIKKMLFHKLDSVQLLIVTIGAVVGFLFLLTVVHYFGTIKSLASGADSLGANLVVAQKKVSKYAAFDSNNAVFTTEDLDLLNAHPAIQKVAPVVNNQFYVSLAMREEGLPYFSTDIFIQAVDDDMLDLKLEDWRWNENSEQIPLVMPRDFMLMLNQFAASYNIPQVSEEIAKTLNPTIDDLKSQYGTMFRDDELQEMVRQNKLNYLDNFNSKEGLRRTGQVATRYGLGGALAGLGAGAATYYMNRPKTIEQAIMEQQAAYDQYLMEKQAFIPAAAAVAHGKVFGKGHWVVNPWGGIRQLD